VVSPLKVDPSLQASEHPAAQCRDIIDEDLQSCL
jgi:hypothetical protein